jgi:hypothetical protein
MSRLKSVAAVLLVLVTIPSVVKAQPDVNKPVGNSDAGAQSVHTVLPPSGGSTTTCVNSTSCGSFIGSGTTTPGAQSVQTVITPSGNVNSQCTNSSTCSTFIGSGRPDAIPGYNDAEDDGF